VFGYLEPRYEAATQGAIGLSPAPFARLKAEAPNPGQDTYFICSCVDGTPDAAITYRIRYQVYCVERGLFPREAYPSGLEFDRYDPQSIHILARHVGGRPAGTARLVLPSPLGFPMMRHCVFSGIYQHLNDPYHPAHAGYAEISRLSISRDFRRRDGDTVYGGPPREGYSERHQSTASSVFRQAPEIMIGICSMLYQESKRRGVTHWMVAMERSLYLMLKRLGFRYCQAGPEVDYFGPVRPYVTSIEEFEACLYATFPDTLRYLAHGLEHELIPNCLLSEVASRSGCS
jgi:N-acyl amino acid synthase of PEP-CTERM/exosortase system